MDSLDAAAIGAALISQECAEILCQSLTPDDFTSPIAQSVFDAICRLQGDDLDVTPLSVAAYVERNDEGWVADRVAAFLGDAIIDTPAISTIGSTVRLIRERSRGRHMVHEVGHLSEMIRRGADVEDVVRAMRDTIESSEARRSGGVPEDLFSYAQLNAEVARRHEGSLDWVIPGMLRRRWRALFVAGEGTAKSTILRQCVIMCAAGKHPFAPSVAINPCRTLTIDAENPIEVVKHQFDIIMDAARLDESQLEEAHIWACEGGIDLRRSSGQTTMEAILEKVRPDLVTLGPIYKLGQRNGDDWDEAATELILFLDAMRCKYNFALMLEHHAPQARSDGSRDLRPFGSSTWLRWPEFGIKLVAEELDDIRQPHKVKIDYWRPPRISAASWPSHLERSKVVAPWLGVWPPGHWAGEEEAAAS